MSEQTDQRKALLQRWYELEPQECLPKKLRDEVVLWGGGPKSRAILLGELIHVIRLRGWHYCLASDDTASDEPETHHAFIHLRPTDVVSQWEAMEPEPCDALLSAYVQALEATKEKE